MSLWVLFVALFPLLWASGCEKKVRALDRYAIYTSYRDIPGITPEEINALEALKSRKRFDEDRDYFIYGMNLTTETFYNEDGQIAGYSALFCDWLSTLLGIPFKPVIYEWGDLIKGLQSLEIDFSGELTATEERRKVYFMSDVIAERSIKYMRLSGGEDLSSIARKRPLHYAFLEGATTAELVAPYITEDFKSFFIDDYDTAYRMLKNGEIDAFFDEGIAEAAFDDYGDVRADEFFPLIYGPVSLATQNPDLQPVISVVQKALQSGSMRHLIGLYNQGQKTYMRHKFLIQLSPAEKAYIQDHVVREAAVPIGVEHDNYPVSFYNPQEKEWQGIALDVLAGVEELSDLSFRRINDETVEWPELMDMLERGEAAMITELIPSGERTGRFLWADTAYQSDYYALLSKSDFRDIGINEIRYARVGLMEGTAYAELFREWFPDHGNTAEYPNTDDCFTALEKGEVDLIMATRNLLLSQTNFREQPGYKANIVFNRSFESAFGFNLHEEELKSIIDKCLRIIDTDGITERWTHRTFDYRSKLARSRMPWLIGFSVLLLFVLTLLFIMFQRNRQEGRRLEKLVHQRTRELETQTEAAQVASRAKSDFLSKMSHEIRTPMNAIIGMTAIAKSSPDPERKDYCLSKIEDSSAHLLGVINDILDMSKIEANKLELSPAEFDFEKMLQRVVNVINFRVEEKQQNFTVHIGKDIPRILIGDDQRLAQVITNLLSNAVKFTPEKGSIRLKAELLREKDGLCTLQIKVSDSGIGISEEQQSRLFNSFEQADSGISRKFGGTGLGLAISKRIVELMGGRIWIESEVNKGSTFIFTIGILRGQELQTEQELLDPAISRKNLRILVVDDERDLREYFEEIVRRFGLACDSAQSGQEALELLEQRGPYNIYFVNWKMSEMDGIELSRRINERPGNKPFIILMSSGEWGPIEEQAKSAGVNGFLSKPLFPSAIMDSINKSLGVEAVIAAADTRPAEADNFEGFRIILAEDVEINREILGSLLEPTRIAIDYAENGAEAVRLFDARPEQYQMIFMDVQMPEMDGYEATGRIRKLEASRREGKNAGSPGGIPIIAMTANVFREDIEKCLRAGMNDHVGKPLNLEELLVKLRKYLPLGANRQGRPLQ
ncbi:MAG: response regulator [Treponema sp.]|jgi:signal transduction histidine kinase/DNA-binding response OmpR family regulator|nr:response regulator [Treponema sp.]